jgi:oligopeptidase B
MSTTPPPPRARVEPFLRRHLGRTHVDPYAWLEEASDPRVRDYVDEENAYARSVLEPMRPLVDRLAAEMRGHMMEEEDSAPRRWGPYLYYTRFERGRQFRLFCRRPAEGGPEEIVLDENALAKGHPYCFVGVFVPSPDHNLLAYAVDWTGSWTFTLFVRDLRSGQDIIEGIPRVARTAAWSNDGHYVFYTAFDETRRPYQLQRRCVEPPAAQSQTVYEEKDPAGYLFIRRSRSGEYFLLIISGDDYTEIRYLPTGQPLGRFEVLQPRRSGLEYFAEHHGDRFLVWTNEDAPNSRLMEARIGHLDRSGWREILPHRPEILLDEVSAFAEHLVIYERSGGAKQIRVSAPDGISDVRYVAFPDAIYSFRTDTFREHMNPDFATHLLRFHYSSYTTPDSAVDYDMRDGTWHLIQQQKVPGFIPERYVTVRLEAPAPDGALVPLSLVHRRDLSLDGSHPLLLEGYGAYGRSIDPSFNERLLPLLDRGFVCGVAYVRGSNARGRVWYEQGRLQNKMNSFTDFIACAETLIRLGYTSPARLAITGVSAGGVLLSAVLNLRPDLYGAAVALMPFTNVVATMMNPDLPLVANEVGEWGDPQDPLAYDYLQAYSPYDRVTTQAYPSIFARAGWNDQQVPYWDPLKWVARLRACKTDSNPLVLLTNMEAGHSGASGRTEGLTEDAEAYAFLIRVLGAPEDPLPFPRSQA